MMAQWHSCKESANGALLFFRLGDFYEAFYDDAEAMSKELDLTLTKRGGTPMAGVPHHMIEVYIDRLVAKGYRVAIAEQTEDPREVKGIVKREVVRIVTPGTVINSSLIEDKEASYLATIAQVNKRFGLAYIDITTADFRVCEFSSEEELFDELSRIGPKEVLLEKKWKQAHEEFASQVRRAFRPTLHTLEGYQFDHKTSLSLLCKHFKVHSLDGFGLKGSVAAVNAAGALFSYISDELSLPLDHVTTLRISGQVPHMRIDTSTQRHLELINPLNTGQKEATLLYLLDETKTPMGGRLLRHQLLHPLLSPKEIEKRQDKVEEHAQNLGRLLELRSHLGKIQDLERLMMRIETGYASPRDLVALRFSLEKVPEIAALTGHSFSNTAPITEKIATALVEQPPMRLSDGGAFQKGYDPKLDEYLTIKADSKLWIANYQTRLRELHQIKTLKVGFTKAFGYYIEVSKGQKDRVPEEFVRRQTLVNAERFVTNELKEFEYKILSADSKITALEAELFNDLRTEIATFATSVREIARSIAKLDFYASLAKVAIEKEWVRPKVDESSCFDVKEGRHPIIEANQDGAFIPNDIHFEKQLAIITGPNMAGKSTFIRQAALIAILAQIGSFIPAKEAHIGVIDQVFSRIGATDDLTRGQSTFMVEMTETANILRNATDRSLVILDEIGRGTSTYDGISIAWAVAEYLLSTVGRQAKTLFATHYFEMTELTEKYQGAFNLNVVVKESDDGIVFLRKIEPGCADKSYGIHVARLAGLPHSLVKLAEKKLRELEKQPSKIKRAAPQLDLFVAKEEPPPPHPLVEKIEALDVNSLTPFQALQLLAEWKSDVL